MADDEGTPSVPRKKKEIELSRGVVILPPERYSREEKEEIISPKPAQPVSYPPPVKRSIEPVTAGQPAVSNILAVAAIIFALLSLALSYVAISNYGNLKTELKGIAADLREFKTSNITITSSLGAIHSVNASVPLKNIISPFTLPVQPQDIQGTGTISVVLPGYSYPVGIPWNGTLTVFGTLNVNTSQLSEDKRMGLSYTLPGEGDIIIQLRGSDIWTKELEEITNRIERLSK